MMLAGILYIPLLFLQLHATPKTFTWESAQMSFSSSLVLVENEEKDFWSVLDTSYSFLMICERISLLNCERELLEKDVKNGAFRLAALYHYKKVKNGGPIVNFQEGYYVTCKINGEKHYVVFIIDRPNGWVYQLCIENSFESDDAAMELINSLKYD